MPLVTWDHVHLRTPDPEAMAPGSNVLGGVIIRGPGRIDVKLGGANIFIAKVEPGDGVNAAPMTPYQGLDHFGLTVQRHRRCRRRYQDEGGRVHQGAALTIRPGVQHLLHPRPAGHLDRAVGARREICVMCDGRGGEARRVAG